MFIPTGYGQLSFFFAGTGAPTGAACTLGFHNSASLTSSECADAANTAWFDNIIDMQTGQIDFLGVLCKLGPNDTGPSALSPSSVSGGAGGDGTPPNVAVIVSKITDLGGRHGRGRMYIPGPQDSVVNGAGTIDNTAHANWQTALTNFYNDLVTATLDPVLLHTDPSPAPTAIEQFVVQTTVATQRRRLRR